MTDLPARAGTSVVVGSDGPSTGEQVRFGIEYFLRHQNTDGGIPSTDPSQPSGAWTTAHALAVCLHSPHVPRDKFDQFRMMAKFLLSRRIAGAGWEMAQGSAAISILPTGSAIVALSQAKWLFHEDSDERQEIELATAEAAAWLKKNQSADDGGWSVEIRHGGRSESRVISTYYAIRGLLALRETAASSRSIQRAVEYLVSLVNQHDGGFSRQRGGDSDICSTARAVFVLLECGAYSAADPVIKRAVAFLLDHCDEWRVSTEKHNTPGASGMITYHGNTPYDVSLALLRYGYAGRELRDIRSFFLRSQDRSSGCWYLADTKAIEKTISTWSTAEAIECLDYAEEILDSGASRRRLARNALKWKVAGISALTLAVGDGLARFGVWSKVAALWMGLPQSWRTFILTGLVATTIVGVARSILLETLGKLWRWLTSYAKRQVRALLER